MNCKEKLLTLLDFSTPGLEEAGRLSLAGDVDGAVVQVVRHFRGRRTPRYLFEASDAGRLQDGKIIEEAEAVMRHEIFGHAFNGPIDWRFNPTAETSRDNEWSWSLFRTIYWQPLARAYALTKDDRYVREIADELKSFYEAWPAQPFIDSEDEKPQKTPFPGHAWRTIETGIRIYTTWLPCFEIIRDSVAFDEESWAVFLCSIHDHGTFLKRHYSNHSHSSNWLSMEASSLLQQGIMFPEMTDSSGWTHAGYQRIMHEIAYCFDNDGVHMEHTPIYHLVASIAFLQAVRLCQLNGIPVAPYAMTLLERSAEYLMRIVKPDFSTPMIGDADRNSLLDRKSDTSVYEGMNLSFFPDDLNELRAYFKLMSRLTGRKDFLYVATGGTEGEPPAQRDFPMQETGLYVSRTGWTRTDSYMHVHGVQLERGEKSTHSHNDNGHVELMLHGEDILIDCGRYIYNSSCWKDWRHYFTYALAHNTLYVDDHLMGSVPGIDRVRGVRTVLHAFRRTDSYQLIDVSHNGYAFMDDPVFHRRKLVFLPAVEAAVVVDYVTGLGGEDHDLRLVWNFAGEKVLLLNDQVADFTTPLGTAFRMTSVATSADSGSIRYAVDGAQTEPAGFRSPWTSTLYCGSEAPIAGWVSYGYPVRKPTGQVQRCLCGRVPATSVTVIGRRQLPVHISIEGDRAAVEIGGMRLSVEDEEVEVV